MTWATFRRASTHPNTSSHDAFPATRPCPPLLTGHLARRRSYRAVASCPLARSGQGPTFNPAGLARFVFFHECCLSENNYFDQLNFTLDCHDYIAVTHRPNRNCNCLGSSFNFRHQRLYVVYTSSFVPESSCHFYIAHFAIRTNLFYLRNVHNTLFT